MNYLDHLNHLESLDTSDELPGAHSNPSTQPPPRPVRSSFHNCRKRCLTVHRFPFQTLKRYRFTVSDTDSDRRYTDSDSETVIDLPFSATMPPFPGRHPAPSGRAVRARAAPRRAARAQPAGRLRGRANVGALFTDSGVN